MSLCSAPTIGRLRAYALQRCAAPACSALAMQCRLGCHAPSPCCCVCRVVPLALTCSTWQCSRRRARRYCSSPPSPTAPQTPGMSLRCRCRCLEASCHPSCKSATSGNACWPSGGKHAAAPPLPSSAGPPLPLAAGHCTRRRTRQTPSGSHSSGLPAACRARSPGAGSRTSCSSAAASCCSSAGSPETPPRAGQCSTPTAPAATACSTRRRTSSARAG